MNSRSEDNFNDHIHDHPWQLLKKSQEVDMSFAADIIGIPELSPLNSDGLVSKFLWGWRRCPSCKKKRTDSYYQWCEIPGNPKTSPCWYCTNDDRCSVFEHEQMIGWPGLTMVKVEVTQHQFAHIIMFINLKYMCQNECCMQFHEMNMECNLHHMWEHISAPASLRALPTQHMIRHIKESIKIEVYEVHFVLDPIDILLTFILE